MSASACSARGHQQQVDRIVIEFRWLSRVALANPPGPAWASRDRFSAPMEAPGRQGTAERLTL